jgi:hypothetical protein
LFVAERKKERTKERKKERQRKKEIVFENYRVNKIK